MNRSQVVSLLIKKVDSRFKTKRDAAIWLGISDTHLNRLITGEYDLPQHVCEKLGLTRKTATTYHKLRN